MKIANLKQSESSVTSISFQLASTDIWDKKYRLKTKDGEVLDATIDNTFERVASALADVEDTPEKRAKFISTIPLGRLSLPKDMAYAALFLCSDEAEMITGLCMEVDGGRCF